LHLRVKVLRVAPLSLDGPEAATLASSIDHRAGGAWWNHAAWVVIASLGALLSR
jgi:hypothetical protein